MRMDIAPECTNYKEFGVASLWREPRDEEDTCFAVVSDIYWPHPRVDYCEEALSIGCRVFWFGHLGLDGVEPCEL